VELSPGTILLGKYRIEELIGTGGMGNVVRASHLYLHQPVAIKVLLAQMADSDSTKQRFLREAQATVRLKSEHSARVMDVGTVEGVPFMVMEFLDGNDLNQILRHHGPQEPAVVVDLMLQACEGIAEAHALGIVHRDIKPSNFFITRRPDGSMLLKILDFGISKTPVGYEDLTGTQTVIGTPSYMAPEQMKSGRSADPRSDIWSIGVVIYQLLNGRLPFAGETYAELVLKVGLEPPEPIHVPLPTGLAEVILRCLEKDPNLRHQNVGELARMLAPYASDPMSAAQSAGRAGRILQHRGAQMHGSPLTASGLAVQIPISPAQLTPRSWPTSQGTSLSQGAGQVMPRPRSKRGLLVAGIASLCALAGVGGYAISQASRAASAPEQRSDHRRDERHVDAPVSPPRPPSEPPAAARAVEPEVAAPPAGDAPVPPTPAPAAAPAIAEPTPAAAPAIAEPTSAAAPAIAEPTSAAARPGSSARPAASADAPSPPAIARPTPAKPPAAKPAAADPPRPVTKPAVPPAARPAAKPKKSDDLFDSRH
jgi:serine/threonine-protein kinase